jgi:UDP-GlcNAc3NAcA epimerase
MPFGVRRPSEMLDFWRFAVDQVDQRGINPTGIRMIEQLRYLAMAWLSYNSATIYTDLGGLQKEAYFHRVPYVTLRDETEWGNMIDAGPALDQ